ncbi:hypothetical protein OG21DRAFT_1284374 [Imleria badia]|nr:hypothetical protein OG21DRAFT_1284374 [Imleria badia]
MLLLLVSLSSSTSANISPPFKSFLQGLYAIPRSDDERDHSDPSCYRRLSSLTTGNGFGGTKQPLTRQPDGSSLEVAVCGNGQQIFAPDHHKMFLWEDSLSDRKVIRTGWVVSRRSRAGGCHLQGTQIGWSVEHLLT